MTTGPRLSIIPAWIITDPRLKGKDLQVLCMLGRNANTRHGWCRRSQVQLSKALDCSRSTVQAAINRLVEIGALERREVIEKSGRDSAHWYRVVYDSVVDSSAFDAWDAEDEQEFDPNQELENRGTPAGISAPPADPESAPPAGSGPAPINASSLTPPDKRNQREARERGSSEVHGTINAALIKRVQSFCTGHGYREGEWPKWMGSTIGHIAQQFAKLTGEQQDAACAGRDVFLAKCERDRTSKPMPVANYFRDLVWEMLTDADRSAFASKHAGQGGPQQAVNGRIAAPIFGPVWSIARMMPLLNGPADVEPADREKVRSSYETLASYSPSRAAAYAQRKGLWLDADGTLVFPDDFDQVEYGNAVLAEGYPEVNRLHEAAKNRERAAVSARYEALKDLVEPVKVGSQTWSAWREKHERENWPWVPDTGTFPVVYFPKGGPEGLSEFERAARSMLDARANDDAE
jgi:hypothetical protein